MRNRWVTNLRGGGWCFSPHLHGLGQKSRTTRRNLNDKGFIEEIWTDNHESWLNSLCRAVVSTSSVGHWVSRAGWQTSRELWSERAGQAGMFGGAQDGWDHVSISSPPIWWCGWPAPAGEGTLCHRNNYTPPPEFGEAIEEIGQKQKSCGPIAAPHQAEKPAMSC